MSERGSSLWPTATPMQTRDGWTADDLDAARAKVKAKAGNGNGFGLGLGAACGCEVGDADEPLVRAAE